MAYYELSMRQVVWDQQCLNLFNFYSSGVGPVAGGAEDLVDTWRTAFTPVLRALLRQALPEYSLNSVYAYDVNNPDDFFEYVWPNPVTGLNGDSGAATSPFMSFAFRTDRWRVGRNRGYKRFSGICEGDIAGNVFTPGGTLLADIVTALEATVVGAITAYYPSIAGKEKYVPDPLKPDTYAYKYYDSEAVQRLESSLSNIWNAHRLTTQRSRIAGHGQ